MLRNLLLQATFNGVSPYLFWKSISPAFEALTNGITTPSAHDIAAQCRAIFPSWIADSAKVIYLIFRYTNETNKFNVSSFDCINNLLNFKLDT